jgi:hypothetical protein
MVLLPTFYRTAVDGMDERGAPRVHALQRAGILRRVGMAPEEFAALLR